MPISISGSPGGGRGGLGVGSGSGTVGTGAVGAESLTAAQSGVLRARGRSVSGPVAIPVQLDALRDPLRAADVMRVLDNVVRQLTAVREGPVSAAKPAQASDDADVLEWLL